MKISFLTNDSSTHRPVGSAERRQFLVSEAVEAVRWQARDLLDPLLRYDETHNGDLVRTLREYLRDGCNASRTAEHLYLHRSGLLYRIRRIEDLLSARLDDFETRVALELAVLCLKDEPRGRE